MHATGDVARQVLSVLGNDDQLGILPVGGGNHVAQRRMQRGGKDQDGGAKLFQRHQGLLIVLRLGDHTYFIFHRQHLCGAGAKNRLIIRKNQLQHAFWVL